MSSSFPPRNKTKKFLRKLSPILEKDGDEDEDVRLEYIYGNVNENIMIKQNTVSIG